MTVFREISGKPANPLPHGYPRAAPAAPAGPQRAAGPPVQLVAGVQQHLPGRVDAPGVDQLRRRDRPQRQHVAQPAVRVVEVRFEQEGRARRRPASALGWTTRPAGQPAAPARPPGRRTRPRAARSPSAASPATCGHPIRPSAALSVGPGDVTASPTRPDGVVHGPTPASHTGYSTASASCGTSRRDSRCRTTTSRSQPGRGSPRPVCRRPRRGRSPGAPPSTPGQPGVASGSAPPAARRRASRPGQQRRPAVRQGGRGRRRVAGPGRRDRRAVPSSSGPSAAGPYAGRPVRAACCPPGRGRVRRPRRSERVGPALTRTDPHDCVDRAHPHLAVADPARSARLDERVDDVVASRSSLSTSTRTFGTRSTVYSAPR